jgi:putative OPT family oligopeptide transporter
MATPAPSPRPDPAHTAAGSSFQPYVPASEAPAEFTLKAIVIGALFGLLFGASTVYLGLRAGLTVSASIPIAVLAISVLKRLGGSTILENNMVQTIGSAGESVAGGVVFTVPALIFLASSVDYFTYFQITMLTLAGGILGVLMMVPLRRALIVKEHGILPYPEGTACAEVLVAGEKGGKLSALVFGGLGIGALWKALSWVFNLFRTEVGYTLARTSQFPNATLNLDISPEYLGVGYVIGPRIAGTMFAGGVLSWLVFLPLLTILGQYITVPFPPIHPNFANNPATGQPFLISEMAPGQIWSAYIRYIGAGAVLAAGLITLARTIPTIVSSAVEGLKGFGVAGDGQAPLRTEREIPMSVVLIGTLLVGLFLAFAPRMPLQGNLLAAALIILFGFFFATVSSRITGLIGSSSNPISGMTIATLILTCLLFVALGWTGDTYGPVAICVGAVVCIAAANAGNTSQDLKTGYIVGATPFYQQLGLIIGVVVSALSIGWTTLYLHKVFVIGSADIAAPQATLMATIIKGLLSQNLPWGLVLIGVFVSVTLELCGIHSLSFAVGSYLPIATTAPIFVGGLVKWWVQRSTGQTEESDLGAGTLFSSGLIAGGSICGILFAVLVGTKTIGPFQAVGNALPWFHADTGLAQIASLLLFFGLAAVTVRAAKRKIM